MATTKGDSTTPNINPNMNVDLSYRNDKDELKELLADPLGIQGHLANFEERVNTYFL